MEQSICNTHNLEYASPHAGPTQPHAVPLLPDHALADVIDSWVSDKKVFGNYHKGALDKLLGLNLFLRQTE